MGLSAATSEFLIEAVRDGANVERTGTIGRQFMYAGPYRLMRLLRRHGQWPGDLKFSEFVAMHRVTPGLVDPLLRVLGANEITSFDASGYEGADVVHDLNEPIPSEFERRFTLLLDGGTLEHVFNVPEALRSYMRMVDLNGTLIIHTVINNYAGHGFYQFSPELFYRVLTPHSGYEIERMVIVENDLICRDGAWMSVPLERAGRWYDVADPAVLGERVLLQTRGPAVIQVQARRTAITDVLESPPQQSDYAAVWRQKSHGRTLGVSRRIPADVRTAVRLDVMPLLMRPIRGAIFQGEKRARSFRNTRHYRRTS